MDYHHKINKANLYITKNKYDSALFVFRKAFEYYPKHFYNDVHNACLCAVKIEDYALAIEYAKELVLHGYVITDFEEDCFSALRKSALWGVFEERYLKIRESYLDQQNDTLRNVYHKLFLEDQNAAKVYGNCNRDELYEVYYGNAKILHSLYCQNGLPNFLRNKDTLNLEYWAFFRHYFGIKNIIKNAEDLERCYKHMKFDSLNWKTNLLQELHKGNLSPKFFSQVVSYHDTSQPFGKCAIRLNFKTEKVELFTPLPKEKAKEVSQNRYSIGLMANNELNSSMLKTTWYAYYPFKEIKQAYTNCESCFTDSDYFELLDLVENKAKNAFRKRDIFYGFLLDDYRGIKERWVENLKEYKHNLDKNDSCSKRK